LLSIVATGVVLSEFNKRRMTRGVCRYCQCETPADTDICDQCWANNNAW